MERGIIGSHVTTVYKAINGRDGMPYCLRRIHSKLNDYVKKIIMNNYKR